MRNRMGWSSTVQLSIIVAYLASVFGDIDIGFKGTHVNRANKALKNIPAVE